MLKLKLMARTSAGGARARWHPLRASRSHRARGCGAAPDDSEAADEGEAGRGHGHGSTRRAREVREGERTVSSRTQARVSVGA